MQNLKYIFPLVALLLVSTACSNSGSVNFERGTQATFNTQEDIDAGSILYMKNCAACHGDLTRSELFNVTASSIFTALQNNRDMKLIPALQSLSKTEVYQITAALKFGP